MSNGAGAATSGTLTGGTVVVVSPGVVVEELVLVIVVAVVLVPGSVVVVEVPPGAVPTARPRSMRPTPNWSSRPGGPRSCAVASSRSTAACGLSPVLRSTASAPDTWGAAIEVPARHA